MNVFRCLSLFSAVLVFQIGLRADDSFVLAPHLTDNMVVQSGSDTLFYGLATPGEKVRVEVKGRRFSPRPAIADKTTGRWSREISFGSASTQPLEIEIFLGAEKEPERVLRNVLVGEVWIVGVALGQGINVTNRQSPSLRFTTISTFDPAKRTSALWRAADEPGLGQGYFDLLAFEFAQKLGAPKGTPIGIIHLPGHDLTAALRERPGPASPDLAQILEKTHRQVQEETRSAIVNRGSIVRQNKKLGLVVDTPRINLYGKYRVYSTSQFQSKADFMTHLTFRGVIGPDPAGE